MELEINDFLEFDEEILFRGTYNLDNVNQTGPNILTLEIVVENNPNGSNILVDNFYNTYNNLVPPTEFLLETITLASYTSDTMVKKNGQIQYTSFYKNESTQGSPDSPETTKFFVLYAVNSAIGIYSGVTKVLLNAMNEQRILYFIGKKCA